ncbi:acyltransferase family protein [Lonepinella sp. BR2357]|uniref:acyltransferase family protein n=1 Tax=Lonepinella sp. BR2357 TaxID=3434549 RepID=UPI003F6DFD11
MTINQSTRIETLDYIKAIGIFLVILGHSIPIIKDSTYLGKILVQNIYSFHMPLFFILSGIILEHKNNILNKTTKIRKIIYTYLIPYLSWSIIYILLLVYYTPNNWEEIITERSIATITGRGIAPLWFLFTLAISEIIFLLLLRFKEYKKTKNETFFVYFILITILTTIFLYNIKMQTNILFFKYLYISAYRIIPALFFISLGYISYPIILSKTKNLNKLVLAIMLAFITFGINNYTKNSVNLHLMGLGHSPYIFFMTGILGSLSVILFCTVLPNNLSLLSSIGKHSFTIMVLHYPPFKIIYFVSLSFGNIDNSHSKSWLVSLFTLVVCYILSITLLKYIRKYTKINSINLL